MPAPRTAAVRPSEPAALAQRGGRLVTMDPLRTLVDADVMIGADGRISALVEPSTRAPAERQLDITGMVVIPGLVQAHLHLCQTLFRGLAEEQRLLGWLRERVWPLEAAHDPMSLRASARLGLAELLLGGTTAILDMGTVHHTDALFEAAAETGIRYTGGKPWIDTPDDGRRAPRRGVAAAGRARRPCPPPPGGRGCAHGGGNRGGGSPEHSGAGVHRGGGHRLH